MKSVNFTNKTKLHKAGFTLVELIVTVAIIGILSMIAFPSYTQYVARGNRTVAKAFLVQLAGEQESYLVDRKRYADKLTKLRYPADIIYINSASQTSATRSTDSLYKITIETNNTFAYTLNAEAINHQLNIDKKCLSLQVTQAGEKMVDHKKDNIKDCWRG